MPSLLVDLFTCLLNLTTSDLNSTITYVEYHDAPFHTWEWCMLIDRQRTKHRVTSQTSHSGLLRVMNAAIFPKMTIDVPGTIPGEI